MDQEIVLADAVLTEFRFVNPHVYVFVEVTGEQGAVQEWRCEMAAASRLKRRGWTAESLLPGQVLTIDGEPGRREKNVCHVASITLEDGTALAEYDGRPTSDEVSGGLVAADAVQVQSRPAYLPNGQPNFGGPWVATQQSLELPRITPTSIGEDAGRGLVRHFDSPALRCETTNIVYDWIFERESNEIYQASDSITLQYGYLDQVRTIYLDQPEHPEQLTLSVLGHSIGWWEGETLVVDTVGFTPGVLSHQGQSGFSMYSDQWHVIERFSVSEDGRTLTRAYTFDDPFYVVGSNSGVDTASLTTEPYVPYDCDELSGDNNIRPEID